VAHARLRTFRARPWRVSATDFLKEGRLCYFMYTVGEWSHNNENTELSARAVLAPSADERSVVIGDKENSRDEVRPKPIIFLGRVYSDSRLPRFAQGMLPLRKT
jgi:hypothetical protein